MSFTDFPDKKKNPKSKQVELRYVTRAKHEGRDHDPKNRNKKEVLDRSDFVETSSNCDVGVIHSGLARKTDELVTSQAGFKSGLSGVCRCKFCS